MRGERRLGIFEVGSAQPGAYCDEEVAFLSFAADQVALSIDAAVNFAASQTAQERLKLLLELTNQVVSSLELRDLLRAASASLRRVIRTPRRGGRDAASSGWPAVTGLRARFSRREGIVSGRGSHPDRRIASRRGVSKRKALAQKTARTGGRAIARTSPAGSRGRDAVGLSVAADQSRTHPGCPGPGPDG